MASTDRMLDLFGLGVSMQIRSDSFTDGSRIPARFAMGKPGEDGPVAFSDNDNPHLAWSGAPLGTKSFVLVCHDPDCPTVGDDVNQEDRWVPRDLPRCDFFHWVLVDIPASICEIAAGSHSSGVTEGGKTPGPAQSGVQGVNDYTSWFAGDETMGGDYGGYDGPFPPWNDQRLHHYVFTVWAVDVESLGLSGSFNGQAVREAHAGRVLGVAQITGSYAINPAAA